jgi:predicted ATPase/DNA-binding CsgD family transcriptional regulator
MIWGENMANQMPRGLPAEVTSFVGRRRATAEVKGALSASRLVTLTGVGGTGKSRLALHVARDLRRAFDDGVWLVELGQVQDPSLLGDTVAEVLGLSDLSSRDPQTVLAGYLADKQLLLVLDNCEHLLGDCAPLVAGLLPAAPGLRVLASSREPLGIGAERIWPVPPLSVPRPDESLTGEGWGYRYEALALFEERAAAVVPGFALNKDNEMAVARLCRQLDGLPLAIELAAVRLRVLSIDDLLVHLQDRFRLLTSGNRAAPSRHQTLRAAVQWSFDLCSELERTLWARLSVFGGGFDLAAAEDVCADDGLPHPEVFTGVAGLVDKSLLVRGEDAVVARYRMLDTIRQYGREQLAGGAEVVVRRRHTDHYLRLCEQAEADWFGPRQVEWLDRFRAEASNVSAALEFCLTEPGQARTGLRMAGALHWYWTSRIRDGRYWLDRALAHDPGPSRERVKALWAVGWIAGLQGDATYARAALDECAGLARQLDEEYALGQATAFTGMMNLLQDELPEAAEAYERALAHHRTAGVVDHNTTMAVASFGMIVGLLGDTDRAVALCQESIATCAEHGERWARSWALCDLAIARWLQHDLERAAAHLREALRLNSALGDQAGVAWCVEVLGWISAADEDAQRAAVMFGVGEKLWAAVGGRLSGWGIAHDLSTQAKARAQDALGKRAFDASVRHGKLFSYDNALAYALSEHSAPAPPTAASLARPEPEPELEMDQLTRREREVALLIAQGMSNKEIASKLVISRRTAEAHVEHILVKLGFTSRTQIATSFRHHTTGLPRAHRPA